MQKPKKKLKNNDNENDEVTLLNVDKNQKERAQETKQPSENQGNRRKQDYVQG